MTFKKTAALLGVALSMLLGTAQAETVRVAQFWPSSYVQDNLIALTANAGEFKRQGLDVEIFNINNEVTVQRSSLTAGQADVGLDLYNLRFDPEELTVVATPLARTLYVLVARDEFETLADLGGEVIGTYGCQKLGTVLLMNAPAFRDAGLSVKCGVVESPRDPNVVYLDSSDPGTRKVRLMDGKIAAIVDFVRRGYELAEAGTGGFRVLLTPEEFNAGVTVPPIAFAFGPKVPEEWWLPESGVVDRFLRAISETIGRLDEQRMLPVIAKTFKVGGADRWREVPDALPDDFPEEGLREVEFLRETLRENVHVDLCGGWTADAIAAAVEVYENGGTREMVEARGEAWTSLSLAASFDLRCVR